MESDAAWDPVLKKRGTSPVCTALNGRVQQRQEMVVRGVCQLRHRTPLGKTCERVQLPALDQVTRASTRWPRYRRR